MAQSERANRFIEQLPKPALVGQTAVDRVADAPILWLGALWPTWGGTGYTLTYDVENRLTGVSGGASATVGNSVAATYDGDGNRVKGVVGGVTTYYVGNHYEYVYK